MGYTELETKNAIYRLEFRTHMQSTQEFKRAGADAFVLEWGGESTDIQKMRLYNTVFDFAARNNKELWFPDVDVRPIQIVHEMVKVGLLFIPSFFVGSAGIQKFKEIKSQRLSRRDLIKRTGRASAEIATAVALNPIFHYFLLSYRGKIKKRESIRKLLAKFDQWWPTAATEGRNAISAEKMERFIAPRLKAQLGRTPVIYACFGPGHISLQEMLQNPKRREKILKAFSPPEAFFMQENLRDCVLHRFSSKTKKWECTVFSRRAGNLQLLSCR